MKQVKLGCYFLLVVTNDCVLMTTDIIECDSKPCLNNAFCEDLINEYRCLCPTGFSGVSCEIGW